MFVNRFQSSGEVPTGVEAVAGSDLIHSEKNKDRGDCRITDNSGGGDSRSIGGGMN